MGSGTAKTENDPCPSSIAYAAPTNSRRMEPTQQLGQRFHLSMRLFRPNRRVKGRIRSIQLEGMDLEFRVDTDPDEVRRFIEQDNSNIKVIFSTYHSSSIVSEGICGLAPLDVAIFDEAHKTTGPQGGSFAHALLQENIAIRKRLFFTATSRHYDIRHRNREATSRSNQWAILLYTVHAPIP